METIDHWLINFQNAIRSKDYLAALDLFDDEAIMFGTRINFSTALEEYAKNQWLQIWENSQNFTFTQVLKLLSAGELAWLATLWTNETNTGSGIEFRSGRATFVLQNQNGNWICVHSHFSETPLEVIRLK